MRKGQSSPTVDADAISTNEQRPSNLGHDLNPSDTQFDTIARLDGYTIDINCQPHAGGNGDIHTGRIQMDAVAGFHGHPLASTASPMSAAAVTPTPAAPR
ncbi:hypothetical protein A3218_00785 [Pseudomonas chlororaphis]|nr:hypothetical protein A3218_00785 [Pseudomonas chlororaphis]